MLLNEVEMLCFLSVSHEFCPSARMVPLQSGSFLQSETEMMALLQLFLSLWQFISTIPISETSGCCSSLKTQYS